MENYKNDILKLLTTSDIINDESSETLYKQIYKSLIDHIKRTNYKLEHDIIKHYKNLQIYYISTTNLFIMCYSDNIDFVILNEDELICHISKNINTNIFEIEKKHKLINIIISNIKKESISEFVPESRTIQTVMDIFNTIIYNNKNICKYVLIVIGELIRKKELNDNCFVNNDFKKLIKDIFDFAYSYFKISINYDIFKSKYNQHSTLHNCVIIPCNNYKTIYSDMIKDNILKIILVSLYYTNRYKSSSEFLIDNISDKDEIIKFKKENVKYVINMFDKEYLEDSSVLKLTHTDINYLWKDFCFNKNIPNILSINCLSGYFNSNNLNKTSNKLEYVSEFITFWNNNMFVDKNESEFEISEIQQVLKSTNNVSISEKKILSLLTHFCNVEIENNKYINNLNCKQFNKKKKLNNFKKSNSYDKDVSLNNLYKIYLLWETDGIIIGKNYFIKYI